jgi:predicted ATP-grasp superfamily ATP-dependent carboligase
LDNVHKFPGVGKTPEECLEFLQDVIDKSEVRTVIVATISDNREDRDAEVLYWAGSGKRAHIWWLISAVANSVRKNWMG